MSIKNIHIFFFPMMVASFSIGSTFNLVGSLTYVLNLPVFFDCKLVIFEYTTQLTRKVCFGEF